MVSPRAIYSQRHALKQWKKISGYAGRKIIARGRKAILVGYDIPCDRPELDGRRMLFFSDLHWTGDQAVADDLTRFTREQRADLLIFGGDLVSYACHLTPALELLGTLSETQESLAVVGNWDRRRQSWFPMDKWQALLAEYGFLTLLNSAHRSQGVRFWGTDDYKLGKPRFARPDTDEMSVVICHNPDAVMTMEKDYDAMDLILCGHTHAGQVRIPGIGALKTSSDYWRKFDYGHYVHEYTGTHMIVTAGLGTTGLHLRFWCKPEMVLLTLRHSG